MTQFKSLISEKFSGTIWRLELDEISRTLFAEIRRQDDKQVTFAAVNLETGKVNFKELTMPERWLTGIEAAFDGVLLLHQYQSADSPVHRGLTAIDAVTSAVLWSNNNLSFDHLSVNGPVVFDSRFQSHKLFLPDLSTGATWRPYEPSIDREFQNELRVAEMIPYKLTDLSIEVYGNIAHNLEYNNLRIVSLHTLSHQQLQQELFVLNGNSIVFTDLLNTGIQKIQPEAFMLFADKLIYLKNRSEINVLKIIID